MEESFEARAKRLFGSGLFESVPRSSFPVSSWSVVDGEVERRKWNRERGAGPNMSDDPCSSAFAEGGCYSTSRNIRRASTEGFESDVNEHDDESDRVDRWEGNEDDDVNEEEKDGKEDRDSHFLEMKSFVGLDPTLDNEDEEDEYDITALGKDGTSERLYMSDVNNCGPHLCYDTIFEHSGEEPYVADHFYKDPRADHLAADIRLEEDKRAAENFSITNYSNVEQPVAVGLARVFDNKPKPILKRIEAQREDSKPNKRVRFGPGCRSGKDETLTEASILFSHSMECFAASDPNTVMVEKEEELPGALRGLPGYLANPSMYTRYTFDCYEDDDLANRSAFEDFRNRYKELNSEQLQLHATSTMLPKSILFNPRKKSIDAMPVDNINELENVRKSRYKKKPLGSDLWAARSTSIVAGESHEADVVCKMDEDEFAERKVTPSKRGRNYRSRATSED